MLGNKYGKLTILSQAPKGHQARTYWNCLCECGNTRVTFTSMLTRGIVSACKSCTHENRIQKYRLPIEEFKKRLPAHLSIKEGTYTGYNDKCTFIDAEYGEFEAPAGETTLGKYKHPNRPKDHPNYQYPELYKYCNERSIPYSTYAQIAKRYGIELAWEAIKERNDKTGLSSLEVKIKSVLKLTKNKKMFKGKYFPDFKLNDNLFLNTDGLYYHTEDLKGKTYHQDLRLFMEKEGKQILQFHGNEIRLQMPIVKSIIWAKMGKLDKQKYARKLKIVKLSQTQATQFLNENHLMGSIHATHYGLVDDDDIIYSCMSIKYKNIDKGHLDISRFCTKIFYKVPGGFQKLLNHVKKHHNYQQINYWVDLRYGTGKFLLNSGFVHIKDTLSFKWTDGWNTFNRLHCKATKTKTEAEVAKEKKLLKIYDAGQRLYTLTA